ncbi:MAG: DUF4139 domain-containing protein [Rhodospirillales bacterium]
MSGISKIILLVLVAGSVVLTPANDVRGDETLRLKRVMLSTGGVGYFEHETTVDGDAELVIDVRLSQVNDVLKSIVIYDGKGAAGTVSLPGRKPLEQIFGNLPFGREALESPVTLLNALKGEKVKALGQRQLIGQLIGVAPRTAKLPDGLGTTTRYRVSLLTDSGIQEFMLDEAESVQFVDPALRAKVAGALAAISAHRARDRRRLNVEIKGSGKRTVRVGYVVEVPLWKTSYRLTVDEGNGGSGGLLQGWAIVENMSGQDWNGVELTLVSGNPVTFRQALYSAYYVDRPSVPVEVLGRVLPKPDTGAVRAAGQPDEKRLRKRKPAKGLSFGVGGLAEMMAEAPPPPGAPPARPAVSREAATQVLFRFPGGVSVPSGGSLAIPFVNREVPARRLSLYQPGTHSRHPLATVRLVNDGATGLPPGILTLYERAPKTGTISYVGDARMMTLPAGEERLVSFAVDQKTRISKETSDTRTISTGAIEQGVLRLTVVRRKATTYRVKAPAREDRKLLIEHPRRRGWKLISPDEKKVELTGLKYRIRHELAKGAEEASKVIVEKPVTETVGISSLRLDRVLFYAESAELSGPLRKAFAEVAKLRREVDKSRREISRLGKRKDELFKDQERIRKNLSNVSSDSDIYRRYAKKLDTQENELENIAEALEKENAKFNESAEALAGYIAKLKI